MITKLKSIFLNNFPTRIVGAARVLINPALYAPLEFVTYNQDRLLTNHNCDFIRDEKFANAYRHGENTGSWHGINIHWRAFVACWLAERSKMLEGDFVECGVNRGGLSRTIIEYVNFGQMRNKKFYLLDTYEGLSEKYISEEEKKFGFKPGGYSHCYDDVCETFREFDNVVIIKGTVPDTLNEVTSDKIAYLSLDMNCAEPEIEAAEYFWDKMVSGGGILLDDYGWSEHLVQKRAFDSFAKSKSVMILSLPTGQGLILKP